jgi:hypothetical protein
MLDEQEKINETRIDVHTIVGLCMFDVRLNSKQTNVNHTERKYDSLIDDENMYMNEPNEFYGRFIGMYTI